jgi:acyl carrier protein
MTPTITESPQIAAVVDVIRKAAKIPLRVPITPDSRLVEDLAIDSLDLVGLILQLQDHFDVVIEEDAVPHLGRVADLAAYLDERRRAHSAGHACLGAEESSMERRGLNIRKGFLKICLPIIRGLPLPMASRFVSGIGRMEYRVSHRLRDAFDRAVSRGRSILGCQWDVPSVSRELAGNHVLWRTRDLLLDGVSDHRAREMFVVTGREHLDTALGQGRGCIVLASHFGAHLLPAHWLFRQDLPVRFFMERPRHISRFLARHFVSEGPLGQDKLFISRQ